MMTWSFSPLAATKALQPPTALRPMIRVKIPPRTRRLGFRHRVIRTSELRCPAFSANPPERCYICKQINFGVIWEIARQGTRPQKTCR